MVSNLQRRYRPLQKTDRRAKSGGRKYWHSSQIEALSRFKRSLNRETEHVRFSACRLLHHHQPPPVTAIAAHCYSGSSSAQKPIVHCSLVQYEDKEVPWRSEHFWSRVSAVGFISVKPAQQRLFCFRLETPQNVRIHNRSARPLPIMPLFVGLPSMLWPSGASGRSTLKKWNGSILPSLA